MIAGVAEVAAEENSRAVQQAFTLFFRILQLEQQLMHRLHLFDFHSSQLFDLLWILAVMRQIVMTVRDFDLAIISIAARVGKHESRHASRIGLKRQNHHVGHQSQVLAVVAWFAGWAVELETRVAGSDPLGLFHPTFDFSHAVEVLLEFLLIVAAKLLLQLACVFADEIENALFQGLAAGVTLFDLFG